MFDNWLSRLIKITTLISIISMIIGAIIIHIDLYHDSNNMYMCCSLFIFSDDLSRV